MKKLLLTSLIPFVWLAIIMVSCKDEKKGKPEVPPGIEKKDTLKHLPDVVLESPDKDKQVASMKRKRPVPPPKPPDVPPIDTTTKTACVFLDMDGHKTSGTMWNTNGDIISLPSGLMPAQEQLILDSVRSYFKSSPQLYITTDSTIFYQYASYKRVRIVISETYQWFGSGAAGVAYINSFNWGDGSPAFVFSSLLNYNARMIADAAAHEAGHTFGCRHQVTCVDGVMTSGYHWGDLIMGASYNSAGPRFGIGPCSLGCTIIQNDTLIIGSSIRQ